MASLGISEFFGLWGRGWGFFNPLISRDDFRLYEMGALFGGGESTNWNMQQIQCMVEIWGDLPIRTHSLGWCHIRWPLFSRNWKMMFPKVWVFWWNMLLPSHEGNVFVGVFLDWSVFWLHEGVSRPAEHQHTLSQPKIHCPSFAIFAVSELLRVPGTVGTLPGVQFQLVWIGHFGQNDSPKIIPDSPTQPKGGVVSEHLFREDSEKPLYNCKCSP